jgi:hypothetical protein
MADYYTQGSFVVEIPKGAEEKARAIVDRVNEEFGEDVGYEHDFEEGDLWVYSDTYFDPDHVAVLLRALVEELELPDTIIVQWANSCSKPRVDAFGGGAFAIKRGYETIWIDAADEAARRMERDSVPLCQPS